MSKHHGQKYGSLLHLWRGAGGEVTLWQDFSLTALTAMEYEFDKELINGIKSLLEHRKESIAVAESVTAGLLQFALASADEDMNFFQGGITAYNLGQKSRHLGIDPIHAVNCNCVSSRVSEDMAVSVCKLFCCDWGIGITGYATAVPESDGQVFCHYGVAYKGKVILTATVECEPGDAQKAQYRYVNEVIRALYRYMEKHVKQW